jgi:hypothetical protein
MIEDIYMDININSHVFTWFRMFSMCSNVFACCSHVVHMRSHVDPMTVVVELNDFQLNKQIVNRARSLFRTLNCCTRIDCPTVLIIVYA